jgi:hypothetical protein
LLAPAERFLGRIARRRRLAAVVTGCFALAARALLFPILPRHQPGITDEFSYLLAADTFASGRLANPMHPMWIHFETIHVLQRPAYASMYHVAQGLVLAAAKVLTGDPWLGVYVSVAVMCGTLCWMLQGWLPPFWAFLGGLMAVIRLGLFSYWIDSYWGGAVAAIGGLLVLGAIPRVKRSLDWRHALLLALGIVILANSRPYEGVLLTVASAAILTPWLYGKCTREPRRVVMSFVLPVVIVLGAGAYGTTSYYKRITGSRFRMPYQLDRDEYAPARFFLWQKPIAIPEYRHQEMKEFYAGWELSKALEARTPFGLAKNTIGKATVFWMFFLGPVFTMPLIFGWRCLLDKRVRPLVIVAGVSVAGFGINTWFYPHYAAPMMGATYALVLQGMRHMRASKFAGVVRMIPVIVVAMALLRIVAQPMVQRFTPPDWPMTWYSTPRGNLGRASVLSYLKQQPGQQLALVRYRPDHNAFEEWIYNDASIDDSQVVWAHDMGRLSNAELIRYFGSRKVWIVDADANPPSIVPYQP